MHHPFRLAFLASVVAIVLVGCATPPPEADNAIAPEDPAAAHATAPLRPTGIPIDVHTRAAPDISSTWTTVETQTQMDLASGAQLTTIELTGTVEIGDVIPVRNASRWQVTEALDHDGQPLQYRRQVDRRGDDTITPYQYASAYAASRRRAESRRMPIQVTLADMARHPRVLRKLTVVTTIPVIRTIKTRLIEAPAVGESAPLGDGRSVLMVPDPREERGDRPYRRVHLSVAGDSSLNDSEQPPVVAAELIDAKGAALRPSGILTGDGSEQPVFLFQVPTENAAPLSVRLVLATDVGTQQLTCVARDIPVP